MNYLGENSTRELIRLIKTAIPDTGVTEEYVHTLLNRTNSCGEATTDYTTYMARGEALFSSETTPTINGAIAWTYE